MKKGFEWIDLKPGVRLTQFGDDVEYLYLLVHGTVKILNNKNVAFATVQVQGFVDVPQFIGELSFFTRKPASASVLVCVVFVLVFENVLSNYNNLSYTGTRTVESDTMENESDS